MEYYTMHNRPKVKTPSGNNLLPQYKETLNKDGQTVLKKTGDKDIYQIIQASLEETQVYNILEKFLQTGDETVLKRRDGIYGNFIDIPTSPIELQNTIMRAENEFNELDREVRAEFDNDVGVFKQSILDGSFNNRMSKYISKKQQAKMKPQPQQEQTTQPQQEQTTNQGVNLNE